MEIINELVLMKKYDEAQAKFEKLLKSYPNWEILNENYEYFLANYVNKPELAQNNFIRLVIYCVYYIYIRHCGSDLKMPKATLCSSFNAVLSYKI